MTTKASKRRSLLAWILAAVAAAPLILAGNSRAASVGPAGYTNAFSTQPAAADWATSSRAGGSGDNYTPDSDVNGNITANGVTAQPAASAGNLPSASGTAVWASTGQYLQTRPTGNRYSVLMGKFVNNTGTNATQIRLSYGLTIAGLLEVPEEAGRGTRAYISLTGLANSWVNLPTLNTIATNAGSTNYLLELALNWTNGGNLYLLWIDDNATLPGIDTANQFDNFSLQIVAGSPPPFICALAAPTNNTVFVSEASITASVTLANGTAPFTVEYFTNSGVGNTIFASAGSNGTSPYSLDLGSLPMGTYNIYAVATDSAASPAIVNSQTNRFFVADPIVLTLTAPPNDATFDSSTPVSVSAMVAGGTAPYAVQFYLDNMSNGAAVVSAPYQRNLGALFVGDHTIRASVRDARGWVSNSISAMIHIVGPLDVALTPTNGATFNFGQSITLDAAWGGGTAPYTVTFFTNDQQVGTLSSPPFTTNLGILPEGSYTGYVHIVDSSIPTPQEATSTTNVFTVLPNPLVVNLINPVNGLYVTAGQPLAFLASVTVGAPVTASNVEFFLDGVSVVVDDTAPYSASVSNLIVGNHAVYAVATDSFGRTDYSPTNLVVAVSGAPGSNNHFTNAIPLSGLNVTATGNNVSANREPGEPNFGFGGARSVWWSWVAPDSGLTTIDTYGSTFDTILGVYVGSAINQLTLIGFNDDSFDGTFFTAQSRVDFNAIAGTVYRIQVDGFGGSSGNIVLHITGPNGVIISSPTNGAVFTLGEPIPFTISLSSNFPSPPLTRVDIYRGGLNVGSSTNAPFTAMATNAPLGTNTFYAVVRGSDSLSYTSATVNVFVQNIGVTLLLPQDGSYWNFLSTNPIAVTAWGYLPPGLGTITNIEFYADGQIFGQDSSPPYSALWNNPPGGSHRLTAIGRSDTGASYSSQPVNIAVYSVLVRSGSTWKYLDNGSNQGTNWIAPGFDDSTWASGPSPLGYNDSNGRFPATTNSFGSDPNNRHITTYYRTSMVLTNRSSHIFYYFLIQRDDGVIVYLNGVEVYRSNMPQGTPTYTTLASFIAGDDGGSSFLAAPLTSLFLEGTNIIAAEIHQNVANSPDSWFDFQVIGAPVIVRNLSPFVAITSPTNNAFFLAPSNITLTANASDPDGGVTKVEFFASGLKLGEATNAPYRFEWNNPPIGPHALIAVATDTQGASQQSAEVRIDVYDVAGTPFVRMTSPADGTAIEGGTNLLISAYANAPGGVTNVQFFANGEMIGDDPTSPFAVVWDAPFGTNLLSAVAYDTNSLSATSATVSLRVFPNTTAPTILTQQPPRGAILTGFSGLQVTFSERVQNVNAGDLLINGIPATAVSGGSGTNYLFTFPQPSEGQVQITWTNGHGITDFGYPTNLAFNELGADAQWQYTLVDRTPPLIVARTPAAGSTVTNLAQINVTFSEGVTNVDASDLLVNGTPAFGLTGSGSNYVFNVTQPPMGAVNVTWATNHGIFDLAEAPNAFNGTNTNARWSFTLDLRVLLVQSNSNWRVFRGYTEASTPANAWRQRGFNDLTWSNSPAPFFYGDPYNNEFAGISGTLLSDMQGNYTSIYLRREFAVEDPGALPELLINHQSDDGFIAWLNGVEVLRYNVPGGALAYNGSASSAANEPFNTGAAYIIASLGNNAISRISRGTNVLAVHAFNASLGGSSDFGFNAQLYYLPIDLATVPPRLVSADPAPGDLLYLTNATLRFSEGVSGVDAADLLVNGAPATEVSSSTNTTYTFGFPQPPYGPVLLTWVTNHGIADLDVPPKPFDSGGGLSPATFASDFNSGPPAGAALFGSAFVDAIGGAGDSGSLKLTVNANSQAGSFILDELTPARHVSAFTASFLLRMGDGGVEPADGFSFNFAGDLPISAATPAAAENGGGTGFSFCVDNYQFVPYPGGGTPNTSGMKIRYGGLDITGVQMPTWNSPRYVPVSITLAADGALTVLVDGTNVFGNLTLPGYAPRAGRFGLYARTGDHNMSQWVDDLAVTVLAAAANATVSYTLFNPGNPRILTQMPLASTAVTGLTSITVLFTEPVLGVEGSDLLVNGTPASSVASVDGVVHTFGFVQPPFGAVTIRWVTNHGITDLEMPPNGFDPTRFGGQWNYTLIDPAPSVVITSPSNNGYALEPANIPFAATASDYDGTVSLVEFFVGDDKVGEATNTPYAITISNVLLGSYTLRAVATDNTGLRGTSAPTFFSVVTNLPVVVVRGPYLNSGSSTSGVVRWRTDLPSDAVVWHGPDPASLTNLVFDATMTNEHILTLTGLPADTRWYYSIGTAAQTNASGSNYWFKTAPAAGTRRPYRFWVLGDCGTAGTGSPDRQFRTRNAYYNFAATNGPADIWLMLGDNAYNSGTDAEHQRAIFDIYPDTLRNLFLWPVLGNHETGQSSTVDTFPYLDIFSLPTQGEAGGIPSGTEKYYSFDYGNIHFIGLDSMTSGRTADSPMADWLRADLQAATAEWIIVFFHHPPYTKGNHDSDREGDLISIRENLLPIMEANGVDLVLCGHSHAWERSYLLHGHYGFSETLTESMKIDGGDGRETGDGAYRKNAAGEGVVYTVAGNAGQVTGGSLDHAAHFVSFNELGTMVLDVSGNRLEAVFLHESGEIRDRFTITKPPPTPSTPSYLLAVPTGPNEITLLWTPGSTNHLGFTLERSTDGVGFTQIFALPPEANTALNAALLDNATYYYRIRATNAFGSSDWSAIASATTVPATSAPRAPVGLAASAEDGIHFFRSRIVLTWQDRSTNEAAFQIERTSDGASFVPVATVAANRTAFVDENLESATLYFYRVRSLNSLGLSTPSNLAGDQTHPQNQFARAGETVSFHAGSEGAAPVTYQWRFNGVAIPGATEETLVLTNLQLAAEGVYAAVVRDAAGVVITRPATLIVVAPPRIVSQPQDQHTVIGSSLSLDVVAEGTEPMTYHWRKDGAFLPGANSPSLMIANLQGVEGGGYDVLIENDFGSATSRVAFVTVYTRPSLEPVSEVRAEVLRLLSVSNFVHDPNQPPLQLTFSLAPGSPTNARIHPLTGRFSWTPNRTQAPSTNTITVRVDDRSRPVLSNSMDFTVIVNDYLELTPGSPVLLAGTNGFAPIDFFSSAPLVDLQTVIGLPGARLTNLTVEALAPELATVALLTPDSNTAALTFTATPGNTLQGTQRLARLHFTAAAGQSSAFVPLHVESVSPVRADPGLLPTVLANHGRAVVIGAQPLMDARLTNGARELVVYGRVGGTYLVEYSTNLSNPIWTLRSQVVFTNLSRTFLPGNTPPTNRPGYFRARRQ